MKNQDYHIKSGMVDTHCHIDLYKNPHKTCEETIKQGIKTIAVTNLPSHFEIGLPHILRYKNIRPALGFHPLHIQNKENELKIFLRNVDKTSYIGEIGLDFTKKGQKNRHLQIEVFETILKIISSKSKFITIHSRKAEQEVLDMLIKYNMQPCVFHWYTGPLYLIEKIIKSGHFFSINPYMTTHVNGIKIINKIPKDRILTETDGPFAKVNGNTILPVHVKEVINYLSTCWEISFEETQKQIYSNFINILEPIKSSTK
ncbi:Qat anti-phage system TatD family nuclease QatD [Lysinibacillus sphaericus]|uniref:Qat anti-phage system TatD family nuclease QatD n=1 Tax=Lysinibacillus sphaericus TaxID=1421 RepID=UPI001A9DCCB3|nr:Qat anti-phage system TatD family nuclease QatD [Lysinibacillus sphaericus]QTB25653.1 TatD family hydrolase [Lysinibacillus sphaericus]